jgi:hypothetical protein
MEINLDRVFWFSIKVINRNRECVEFLSWQGLRFELRMKYDWYFKYRAALLQVKYPRFEVQTFSGNEPATGITFEQIQENKIRALRAQITKIDNRIHQGRKAWNSLFPFEEDIAYQMAMAKRWTLEQRITELLNKPS